MLDHLGREQLETVLDAVQDVAGVAEGPSGAVEEAVDGLGEVLVPGGADLGRPRRPGAPEALAAAVVDETDRTAVLELLGVASLAAGDLDAQRISRVADYAAALGLEPRWLELLAESVGAGLPSALEEMSDANLRSITHGRVDLESIDDVNAWLLPYEATGADHDLTARYAELAALPAGTLGHEFWAFYDRHHFGFPGQPGAANEQFTTPHDCTHLLSGYDTTPEGELLVSTFTARMHRVFAMEGHILPVIFSWHLGIELNRLAGSYRGALDLAKFWVASARGRECRDDTFGDRFCFWDEIETPLADLVAAFGVPPLDPRHAAQSSAVAGVDYQPIP